MLDFNAFEWLPLLIGIQIGPRIRVGGTLGKLGQKVKIGVGKLAQPVGKVVSVFNPALGTAISTAGDVLDTTDGSFDFGKAGKNALMQYGTAKMLSPIMKKLPGVSSVMGSGGGAEYGDDIVGAAESAGLEAAGVGVGNSAASRAGSVLSKAGKVLESGDRYRKVIDGIKTASDAYRAYDDRRRRNQILRRMEEEDRRNRPLRDEARRLLLDGSRPDVSDVFRDDGAPGQRYRRVRVGSRS